MSMEEGRRRDQEMQRREEHTARQMELLHSLVQGVQLQGEAAAKRQTMTRMSRYKS